VPPAAISRQFGADQIAVDSSGNIWVTDAGGNLDHGFPTGAS
jgi:hypothetical protein